MADLQSQSFGDDFARNIEERDRLLVVDILRIPSLRYEFNISFVY